MSTNIIEKYYQNSITIPQRFLAPETHLQIGDIDFGILNLPKDSDISNILITLTKLFLKSKMISNYKIIDHANFPIINLLEGPFGFSNDICALNNHRAMNISRVRKSFNLFSTFKANLNVYETFSILNKIDDPSNGGFGSNLLMNFVLFGFQSRPDLSGNAGRLFYLIY